MNTKTDNEFHTQEGGTLDIAEKCLEFYHTEDWTELLASENYEREAETRIFDLKDSVRYVLANGEIDVSEEDADNLIHLLDGLEAAANQFWDIRTAWDEHLETISFNIKNMESFGFYISDEAVELSDTIDGYLESAHSETKKKQHATRHENLVDFFKPLRELNKWLKYWDMPRADFGTLTMLYYGIDSSELTIEEHHLKAAGLTAFRVVTVEEPEILRKVLDKMKTLVEDAWRVVEPKALAKIENFQ